MAERRSGILTTFKLAMQALSDNLFQINLNQISVRSAVSLNEVRIVHE